MFLNLTIASIKYHMKFIMNKYRASAFNSNFRT